MSEHKPRVDVRDVRLLPDQVKADYEFQPAVMLQLDRPGQGVWRSLQCRIDQHPLAWATTRVGAAVRIPMFRYALADDVSTLAKMSAQIAVYGAGTILPELPRDVESRCVLLLDSRSETDVVWAGFAVWVDHPMTEEKESHEYQRVPASGVFHSADADGRPRIVMPDIAG